MIECRLSIHQFLVARSASPPSGSATPRSDVSLCFGCFLLLSSTIVCFGSLTSHPDLVRWESIMQGVLMLLALAPLCCITNCLHQSNPTNRLNQSYQSAPPPHHHTDKMGIARKIQSNSIHIFVVSIPLNVTSLCWQPNGAKRATYCKVPLNSSRISRNFAGKHSFRFFPSISDLTFHREFYNSNAHHHHFLFHMDVKHVHSRQNGAGMLFRSPVHCKYHHDVATHVLSPIVHHFQCQESVHALYGRSLHDMIRTSLCGFVRI